MATIRTGKQMIKTGLCTLSVLLGVSLVSPCLWAADLLSDDPMETKVQTAPANVMFILDNSGSMDWEFIADADGLFHSEYYLFSPGDNVYSGQVLGTDGGSRLEWQSQWSEYNRLYYNPFSSYEPWPRWELMPSTDGTPGHFADLINPRSNPTSSVTTYNIHADYYANLPAGEVVIADEATADVVLTAGWQPSSLNPMWDGTAVFTSTIGDTAVFTPNITQNDNYQIYAWFNCFTARDKKALIEVDSDNNGTVDASEFRDQSAAVDNTPETGVCGEWIPLFGGASYPFTNGGTGKVTISRTVNSTGGTTTVADALAFVATGTGTATIDMKRAHYYVVNDTNGDGVPQVGEVYLVNFIWTDTDLGGDVDADEVERFYSQPQFTGTDPHQTISYVTPVLSTNIPAAIIPTITNEDGTTTAKTAIEDLQNFANWFSFYRRRELTAKAAISRTIADLEGLYVGYYTINSGMRIPVLPIAVEETDTVIVDNLDSGYAETGSWYESGSAVEWDGSTRYTTGSVNTARFTPAIPATGTYQVQAWWNCYNTRDQSARVTIHHNGGDTVTNYNQRALNSTTTTDADCTDPVGSGCCGYWIDLGSFDFTQGTTGYVEIARHAGSTPSTSTVADAIKFIGSGSSSVNRIDDLLDPLYALPIPAQGTPLRLALENVGRYFDQDDGLTGNLGTSPFYDEVDGGACQQSFAIVMSDGYWNGTSPGVGNQDSAAGAPYADIYSDTLADVAWKYYDQDLASGLPDELATNNYDKRTSQHLVTFSIAFGLDGTLNKLDLNGDGTPDSPSCIEDPYFLDPNTPTPTWPDPHLTATDDLPNKIDDMWHAAVNGHGEYFSAKDPDSLVSSLNDLFSNISSRAASGASVSVNGDELTSNIALFQSSYSSGSWTGDVTSYPINPTTGEVLKEESDINWRASLMLQGQDWDTGRKIITYNGAVGQPFRYANLSTDQEITLLQDSTVVDYVRGNEVTGFRSRTKKLGDIIHSAPLLVPDLVSGKDSDGLDNDSDGVVDEDEEKGGVIFAGGNDGMLHVFDANDGAEIMAYVPYHTYYRLHDLTDIAYNHRYFVDATPSYKRMNFLSGDQRADGVDNDGDGCFDNNKDIYDPAILCDETANGDSEDYSDSVDNDGDGDFDEEWESMKFTMLVGGLNKGGKGIYALDISDIENAGSKSEALLATDTFMWEYPAVPAYTYGADQSADGIDNDGDTVIDNAGEDYHDLLDNDGDGTVDEAGELIYTGSDPDMGYSYSIPYIVKSYKSHNEKFSTTDSPWVVIFGNGYESDNGSAVLYIVDAFTGNLVRKIDTGATGGNGLSETTIIDVNNDGRADYVYAGDLKGNLWKFDLTDPVPANWGVVFGSDVDNPVGNTRIDAADVGGTGDVPQPLFTATGQPITTAPDVMHHPSPGKKGYLVIFGTGKFLGEDDRPDKSPQTIYGIWDFAVKDGNDNDLDGLIDEYGENELDPSAYLGSLQVGNTLSNQDAQLLEQTEIDFRYHTPASTWLRTLSDNTANWYTACSDGIDNDLDGLVDETDASSTPERCVAVSPTGYASDGSDNDFDGLTDEADEGVGHAGWFFNLPYGLHRGSDSVDNDNDGSTDEADEAALAGERVIKNVIIRDGRAIVISFIPDDSPCSGGGNSIIHEMDAADGSRMSYPTFDINNDGVIDINDMIYIIINGVSVLVPPTGIMHTGMLHTPVIVEDPDNPRELKVFSSSAGTTEIVWETKESAGFQYWRER